MAVPTTGRAVSQDPAARRLTYVITSLGLGGAQQQVRQLAARMQARGWDVEVVTLIADSSAAAAAALAPGVTQSSLAMRRGRPDPRGVARLAHHLRQRQPAVVHSHMVHANLVARMARLLVRIPVLVCTAHNTIEGGRWVDLAYRYTDRLCDLTTNVSPQAVERYVAVGAAPAGRIRYVANGIDVANYGDRIEGAERRAVLAELGVKDPGFVWLNAGRLAPEKDLATLLRAFRACIDHEPAQHLLLAGDGGEREALQRQANELGLAGHVSFLGYRDDVVRLMRAVDAFVMSSAWEGLPIVLLEAAACRLPAVATRVGGTTEIVLDGVSGAVVEPGDAGELAQSMRAIVALQPAERHALGDAAHRHVTSQFDLDRVTSTWEQTFSELA